MPRPPPPHQALSISGIADLAGEPGHLGMLARQRLGGRHHRHADRDGEVAGGDLVAETAHGIGRGADEGEPRSGTSFREVGAFGQEAIAGMDGVGFRLAGDAHASRGWKIGLDRPEALADLVGLVGLEAMEGELVLLGEHRDRPDTELVRRPQHADGDFRAICDENFS